LYNSLQHICSSNCRHSRSNCPQTNDAEVICKLPHAACMSIARQQQQLPSSLTSASIQSLAKHTT
jgi:hypothetical protein